MPRMQDRSDLARAFEPLHNRRFTSGCLTTLAVWAVVAFGLWSTLPSAGPRGQEAWPFRAGLVVLAGGAFTVVVMSVWGLVFPYRPIVQGSGLPRVTRRGRIVAVGEPLRAPLSGTPCVAYRYTLSRRHRRSSGHWTTMWVHAGAGSVPWALQQCQGPALSVNTVVHIAEPSQELEGPTMLERARRWVAGTAFEPRAGAVGGIELSLALLADMKDVELTAVQPYRRDWVNSQDDPDAPPIEHWEEAVLPVGATATVVGHLRQGKHFVVPPEAIEPIRAATTEAGQQALAEIPDETLPAGDAPQRAPVSQVLVALVLFGGIGAGVLALAWHLR